MATFEDEVRSAILSYADMSWTLDEAYQSIMEEIAAAHADGTVLIVAHGLLLNRVIHALLGLQGRVLGGLGNAHFSELGHAHGAWRLLAHNVGIFHPQPR